MLAKELKHCKYSVVSYVADHIRNEPVNIGVLVGSPDSYTCDSKFVDLGSIKSATETPSFLENVIEKIKTEDVFNAPDKKLEIKYSRKIRLSSPRTVMVDDMHKTIETLFQKFISIKETSAGSSTTLDKIKKYAWNQIRSSKKNAKRRIRVSGKSSTFVFDFFYDDGCPQFFYIISFNSTRALSQTKVFDWSVSDITTEKKYEKSSFNPLIVKPSKNYRSYDEACEHYEEAVNILESKKYAVTCLDGSKHWEEQINTLIEEK